VLISENPKTLFKVVLAAFVLEPDRFFQRGCRFFHRPPTQCQKTKQKD